MDNQGLWSEVINLKSHNSKIVVSQIQYLYKHI